ncbi:unnamed protein product [Lymnaea stagnalis]|uniref:Centrosomal protein of 72 kDa n=1 Tax=Lymnaea stagnalis TaxID=6523 RepID=A0AAV2I0I0_LYMST
MALTLTENLIRSRVNLTHENLGSQSINITMKNYLLTEDIKSLSLPGTFHEKIVSIGTSLRKFSRLKSVDFSRNALESLQVVEIFNTYYNNVSSLEELKRLKHNQNLKEIDLRLNPVTRNEPDYRLYLIHMLPNLQKLDDRGVRDRERQAALTHFSSSQASELAPEPFKQQTLTKMPLPRTEMMAKLMKGPSVLVDDDIAVIDAMNRNDGDFGKPRPLTGSAAKGDNIEDYSLDGLVMLDLPKSARYKDKAMGDADGYNQVVNARQDPDKVDPRLIRYKELYPNILAAPSEGVQRIGEGQRKDTNLMFCDEEEANSKYRGQGFFTPHPEGQEMISRYKSLKYKLLVCHRNSSSETYPVNDRSEYKPLMAGKGDRRSRLDTMTQDDYIRRNKPRQQRTQSLPGIELISDGDQAKEKNLLYSMLNLVDRYWNGTKSLHKHGKFIEQALQFISEYTLTQGNKEDEVRVLRQKVEKTREENLSLRRQLEASINQTEGETNLSLKRAKEDMERMHEEIRHYITENRELQRRLDGYESAVSAAQLNSAAAASDNSLVNQTLLENLQRQNSLLASEVDSMKSRLKQYNQLHELASMLQESHKSLIETNGHLLHELEDNKHKHQREVEQMAWSYNQLKTTLSQSSLNQSSPRIDYGNNNYSSPGKGSKTNDKDDILIL